jgi:hypothetical protein
MSVVAGCSLPDGALLTADCRVTIRRAGHRDVFVDNVQKVFPLATGTAIGFVGGAREASKLLLRLFEQIRVKRCDPVSLSQWIPRLFKYEYGKLLRSGQAHGVAFMVASALFCRPNVIERERVVAIMRSRASSANPIATKFFPAWFGQVLSLPPESKCITFPGTSLTAIYAMRSPDFRVELYRPLEIATIGSGQIAKTYLEDIQTAVLASEGWMQSFWVRLAIRDCVRDKAIDTVGGMYPLVKVKGTSIEFITEEVEIPVGGTRLELSYDADGWIQRNLTEGREMRLIPPWEIDENQHQDKTFNDLEEARRRLL